MLIAAAMVGGCTSMGNIATKTGKIIRDPSIPVGSPGEQPTVISLSMHASHRVNPNPSSMDAPMIDETGGPERFSLNLSSDSEEELAIQMRATLQVMEAALGPHSSPWLKVQPTVLAMDGPRDASGGEDTRVRSLMSGNDPAPSPVFRELGQYDGVLADKREFAGTHDAVPVATPIRFKVIQLRDDAMLLNADFGVLENDLKKALGSTYVSDDDYVMTPGQFKFVDFHPVRDEVNFIAVVAAFHDLEGASWKRVFRIQPKGHRYPLLIAFDENAVDVVSDE